MAPGGPGERAGLQVGDRITSARPGSTSHILKVRRHTDSEARSLEVAPERIAGGIREFDVTDLHEASDGALWFGLYEGAVARYAPTTQANARSKAWVLFSEDDGLNNDRLPSIIEASDGAIWVVSDGPERGLNRFDGKNWTHQRLSEFGGSDHSSSAFSSGDGSIWIGTDRGAGTDRRGGARAHCGRDRRPPGPAGRHRPRGRGAALESHRGGGTRPSKALREDR